MLWSGAGARDCFISSTSYEAAARSLPQAAKLIIYRAFIEGEV